MPSRPKPLILPFLSAMRAVGEASRHRRKRRSGHRKDHPERANCIEDPSKEASQGRTVDGDLLSAEPNEKREQHGER